MINDSLKKITVAESNIRLDVFLCKILNQTLSRTYIQKMIKEKKISILKDHRFISEHKIKPSFKLESGMEILIKEDFLLNKEKSIEPMYVDFKVLYEDEFLAIIHKPPGICVHPAENHEKGATILHGILYRWQHLQNFSNHKEKEFRPGIVHRLDKMTEGVLVIAKSLSTQWKLSRLFQTRNIQKIYLAWLLGSLPIEDKEGIIELPLRRNPKDRRKMQIDPKGRMAITKYTIIKAISSNHHRIFTKVQIELITGRTHQIRAHFQHLKCPVVGDTLYSIMPKELQKYGLLLLAKKLSFIHPETNQNISIEISEPERFLEFERKCKFY